MNRKDEVRHLLRMSPDEVKERAGGRLIILPDVDRMHRHMADDIAQRIAQNPASRLILPVGPTGQYEYLVEQIIERNLTLSDCWFFFMDEYCDDNGNAVDVTHPLSFKRVAEQLLLDQLPTSCGINLDQVIFPDETNIETLAGQVAHSGGIDVCYGGIGIHGHVAFNEPETGVSNLGPRKVRLNDFTVTINAIRANIGGNLENFPRYAYTLGMQEVLNAREIRLYCRNGIALDWANTILRLALFGAPGDDYPVTHIRDRNYVIVTDEETLRSPQFVI